MTDRKPKLIDNLDGNTLANNLKSFLKSETQAIAVAENEEQLSEGRIATAYFSPEGFLRIAETIKKVKSVKLMLGSDPISDHERWKRKLEESENRFQKRLLESSLKNQENGLRAERNNVPFTKEASSSIQQLVSSLRSGNMEVRRYERNFLHAKAYIFTQAEATALSRIETAIAGSSNLTASGLSSNLELNVGVYDPSTIKEAKVWYDKLWADATPFDLASFFDEIFEPKTPFEVFLRVLWELYGDEIDKEIEVEKGLPLTNFQRHGVIRALRLIDETGGVIIADEVGLGKTFIAGEILKYYTDRRQRALLLCPAALRDSTWKQFKSEYEVYLETKSFEELAQDVQLYDEERRPNASSEKLDRTIDEYQLIIIDEAHNYRNPSSPTRADALRALLYGKRKDVLMLTATPVNNSLWDLYHLTRFFVRQDSFLANKGILSIKDRFKEAMRMNPNSLSPDVLYPIVDATTVKRTRRFVKKHYANDQININGTPQTIVFPEPRALTVRYNLNSLMPGLFDLIEEYFDPSNPNAIEFARYKPNSYLINPDPSCDEQSNAATGLILSGLLKRFESSTGSFLRSINRLIEQHNIFLQIFDEGYVVTTTFLNEALSIEDDDFDEILLSDDEKTDVSIYRQNELRNAVANDLEKLKEIENILIEIKREQDPKLKALISELEKIANEAKDEAISREDYINKRKVIIFSSFSDTVVWINGYLKDQIQTNVKLSAYKERVEVVAGSSLGDQYDKFKAAARFAPMTAGKKGDPDEIDILISTDVLAEGVNLQQARHIINYDMPWNPMRLVQRHGRIDRIGSQHNKVYMRTIFPTDRLDALLRLEDRISRKIAMASASVGVVSPIAGLQSTDRDFTETKEEIQKLLNEDASLFERGGTEASTQSGEEYRQTLRNALLVKRDLILNMAWKTGAGLRNGIEQGIFFCAKVGERTYLRFVLTDKEWKIKFAGPESNADNTQNKPLVESEIGRCLRIIECAEEASSFFNPEVQEAAFNLWPVALKNIYDHWMYETDPQNLQPKVRPLNRTVADFIREQQIVDLDEASISKALDILESPWPLRDEGLLRKWFNEDLPSKERSSYLVKKILSSGLEPFIAPEPLPPIQKDDIKLLVWMAVEKK